MAEQANFSQEDVKAKVRQYVIETMLEDDPRGFSDETPLVDGGLLDSFSIVQLILFLEEEFRVHIPRHRMTTADFGNVGSIATIVLGAAKAA